LLWRFFSGKDGVSVLKPNRSVVAFDPLPRRKGASQFLRAKVFWFFFFKKELLPYFL
jgi:hypothetical protein